MHPRIRTQAFLVGALPLAFLIALLVLALMVQSISQAAASLEQHTQVALSHMDRLRTIVEEGGRAAGVAQTPGSESRLAAARTRLDHELQTLRGMVRDDAGMPSRLVVLSRALHEGFDLLDRYAALIRTNQTVRARALAAKASTRALSVRITNAYDGFVNGERGDELAKLAQMRLRAHAIQIAIIVVCVGGILLTLLVSGRFGVGIARRLGHLAENARRLARGEDATPLLGNDEFSDLDVVYQAMMRQIAREQKLNARLQAMLLPQQLPSFDGIRIDTAYVPAAQETEVGGDWYDAFMVNERCICISIGDVAGHGLRAAAVMAAARLAVRTAARIEDDPAQIMAHLNRVICADEPDIMVTALVALLDIDDGNLRYAVAGHPEPMLIRSDGEIDLLAGKGLMLGADASATYDTFHALLLEGWALLLYTDGLVEITRDYFAGMEELQRAASAEFASSAQNIAEAIQQRLFRGRRADDDAALLFVGVTRLGVSAASGARRSWILDARDPESAHRAKRAILWHLGDTIRDKARLASIELVLGELIGNVARHSPGPAEVIWERQNGRTLLRVCDSGKPFAYHRNGDPGDPLAESGRGLFIVRAMASDVRIEHNGSGNVITAVLN